MNCFCFAWKWYEDYDPKWLMHSTASKETFEADCKDAMRAVGQSYLAGEQGWAAIPEWVKRAVAWMAANRGYVLVEPHEYSLFGGYILKEEDRFDYESVLGKELFEAAVQHNEKIEQER